MDENGESRLLLNRYQLLEQIGSGGTAEIYRGLDLMLDRHVAIKILRDDYSKNPEFEINFVMKRGLPATSRIPTS